MAVAGAGEQIIVSPNMNADVIACRQVSLDLVSAPGVMTPTEAFAALEAGADVLKLFPGETADARRAEGAARGVPDPRCCSCR